MMTTSSATRQFAAWAPLTTAVFIVLLPALSAAQEPAKPTVAVAQTPGTSRAVVTEARRREILKAAESLTAETLAEVLRRAESGDVEAEVLAGIALQDGEVAPRDYDLASRLIRSAAEQGHPMGQNMLGNLYNRGLGLQQDSAKAVEWFTKAAAQGYAQAQSNLGQAYAVGRGVPPNQGEAARLFRLAADQGNVDGQTNLGWAYLLGRGVGKNEREAVTWFREATEQEGVAAQTALGFCYANGRGVPRDLAQATAWYRKAAEHGDASAQVEVGLYYQTGNGVRKDKAEAEKWFKKASDQGHAIGSFQYGLLYLQKPGPGRLDPMATRVGIDNVKLSAEQGYPVAAFVVGEIFSGRMFKYHVEADNLEACAWYLIASGLDKQGRWAELQPDAVEAMRGDLPGRIDKARKSLGASRYAVCERRASDWIVARPQRDRK